MTVGRSPLNPTEFRKKWSEWYSCLEDREDPNSISNQVRVMMWDACAFRAINEVRALAPKADEGGVQLNALLHDLLDRTFVSSQLSAIRRLSETDVKMRGCRGVYSLGVELKDLRKNSAQITRAHLCAVHDLPVDTEAPLRQVREQFHRFLESGKTGPFRAPSALARAEAFHLIIDKFTGQCGEKRASEDSLSPILLEGMSNRLGRDCARATGWANKFIAHAAAVESRQFHQVDNSQVRLEDLWKTQETIGRIYSLLLYLMNGSSAPCVPTVDFDVAKYAERPLLVSSDLKMLRIAWERHAESARSWNDHDLGWLN